MFTMRGFGEAIPDEGILTVQYDDGIIRDTAAEKERDMREAGVTMGAREYRMRRYGEDGSITRQDGRGRNRRRQRQ
ncbi:MAG: hypothetical protein E7001_09025 [Coriobacteriaceae bacterium]|nr:hypothetical protein [Coriobacteriaceae bacterium]